MKILVLGSKGQLGRCLHDQLKNEAYETIYTSREQINVVDFEDTKSKIMEIAPDLIINASAYTYVDKAEEDKKNSNLINQIAVKYIANICKKQNCWLIHFSTDYVFDGNTKMPYREDDKTNPQNVYGETKLKGELEIQSSGCKHIIIRTASVFSEYGNNFLKTMLQLGEQLEELSVVNDQISCPTYAQDIARSINEILPKLNSYSKSGTYHYCGDQICSWYSFAEAIFEYAQLKNLKVPGKILSTETSNYPMAAKRPAYSVLDCSKIEEEFGVLKSNWHEGIKHVIDQLYP